MKKLLLVLPLFLLASPSFAECRKPNGQAFVAVSKETLVVSSTAIPLTQATVFPAAAIGTTYLGICNVATGAIRYWPDATNPTAAVGMPVAAGLDLEICGTDNLRNTRLIRQTVDATLSCSYYR